MAEEGSVGWKIGKGVIVTLAALATLGLFVSVLKPLFVIGVLVGAGWLGYRMFASNTAIGGGKEKPALPASSSGGDDFRRRMAELEALERKLDKQIEDA